MEYYGHSRGTGSPWLNSVLYTEEIVHQARNSASRVTGCSPHVLGFWGLSLGYNACVASASTHLAILPALEIRFCYFSHQQVFRGH